MTFQVTEKSGGQAAVAKRLKAFHGGLHRLKVGFQDDAGARDDDSGLSVVDVVTFHEFGLGVPRRSIVADWFDTSRSEAEAATRTIALKIAAGSITVSQGLNQLGLWAVASMQERMSKGIPPPLAESTIARKGSSVPLIDTGQTRSSITYKIESSGAA